MNRRMFYAPRAGAGRARQPGDLRRPARPRPLRPPRGPAALLDAALRRARWSRCSTTSGSTPAVVGGTSLGANVALELATRDPERVRGLFIEMPVLDNALTGGGGLLHADHARPALRPAGLRGSLARSPRRIPRTHYLVDIGLDLLRQRPGPSLAVLEGLLLGETAPHREERRKIDQPALIVGHARDPVHPFSDSGMLAEELENATPDRGELDPRVAAQPGAAELGAGGFSQRSLGATRCDGKRLRNPVPNRSFNINSRRLPRVAVQFVPAPG